MRLLAVAIVAVFVAGACSGDDSDSGGESFSSWQDEVRGICEEFSDRAREEEERLGIPLTEADLVEMLELGAQLATDRDEAIAAVGIPSERGDEVRELQAQMESLSRLFAEFPGAVAAEDLAEVQRIEDQMAALAESTTSMYADLGISGCGGTPTAQVEGPADFEPGVVDVSGEPLPTHAGNGDDPAVGQPIPEVVGADADGNPVTIGADGRPKVVALLAHWCGHCQAQVPVLQEWIDQNGLPDDVDVIAISTLFQTGENVWTPTEWLEGEGWTMPTLLDDGDGSAGAILGLGGTPGYIVVGADGTVVVRAAGQQTVPQFEALIEAARTGAT